tara:strand:- start:1712 stop:2161 length:450 start_codon:yes stop_codon:yes gene_type:complete
MLSSMPEGPVFQNPFAVPSLSSSPPVNNAPSSASSYSSCPNATEREKMHRKHSARTTTARCLPRDFFRVVVVVVVVIFESFVVLDAFQNEDAKVEREKRNKRSDTRSIYIYLFIYLSIYLSSRRVVSFFLSFSLFSRALTRGIGIVIVP